MSLFLTFLMQFEEENIEATRFQKELVKKREDVRVQEGVRAMAMVCSSGGHSQCPCVPSCMFFFMHSLSMQSFCNQSGRTTAPKTRGSLSLPPTCWRTSSARAIVPERWRASRRRAQLTKTSLGLRASSSSSSSSSREGYWRSESEQRRRGGGGFDSRASSRATETGLTDTDG